MLKKKINSLKGYIKRSKMPEEKKQKTESSFFTFSINKDTQKADLLRIYKSGIITLDPASMMILVGKIEDIAFTSNKPVITIACFNSDKPGNLFTCIKPPILKYSDEALNALVKLTPFERKLLFGAYSAVPVEADLDLDSQLFYLRTNGFFSSMTQNTRRRSADAERQ